MARAEQYLGRFLSRFTLAVVPAVVASVVAVFVIYAVHVARTPEPVEQLTEVAPNSDNLTSEERRELTRRMLKERRENPEVPAEVRRTLPLRATTGVAEDDAKADAKTRAA